LASATSFSFQLRYLQTLNSIAAEHNSTIIFPMPMNILSHFMGGGKQKPDDKMS
jgi:erythrocyte band 7 integral membrane protein